MTSEKVLYYHLREIWCFFRTFSDRQGRANWNCQLWFLFRYLRAWHLIRIYMICQKICIWNCVSPWSWTRKWQTSKREMYFLGIDVIKNGLDRWWHFIIHWYHSFFQVMWIYQRGRSLYPGGWSGGEKVLCILHHWGVKLILAYSWARPAILVVGKGRGGMFLFLLFLHFHSCSSFFPVPLFHLLYSLFYLFSPFLWETTQNDPQGLTCR